MIVVRHCLRESSVLFSSGLPAHFDVHSKYSSFDIAMLFLRTDRASCACKCESLYCYSYYYY